MTDDSKSLLLSATSSAQTGGDRMDIDEEHEDKEELDPNWPPDWNKAKKAKIPPIQRPFSISQWDVFRKLLKDLGEDLENVEKRALETVQKRTSKMDLKPTRKKMDEMKEEEMEKLTLDSIMEAITKSKLLNLDHPKQDTTTLLKELHPAKSKECGVDVDRAREAEDLRKLNVIATRTNGIIKKRKTNEDFHPRAYGDETSNDSGSGAEDDKRDRHAAAFESLVNETLIHDDYKRRHVSLYRYINELYLETKKDSLPVLPNFEEVVAEKKKNKKPTKGVQAERQEFLKKYGCEDGQEYEKKRFQALADSEAYRSLQIHNQVASQKNKNNGDPSEMGQLPINQFKEIFTKYHRSELEKARGEEQLRSLWARWQFPSKWTRLPPKAGGKYPTLEDIRGSHQTKGKEKVTDKPPMTPENVPKKPSMTPENPETNSPWPPSSLSSLANTSADSEVSEQDDRFADGIPSSHDRSVPIVLFCKETTIPRLKPDHTHRGQPIMAVIIRKFHRAEYFNLVVKVADNRFQTLPASECGGRPVIAKLSEHLRVHKQPKSFDEVAQLMGAEIDSTSDEKQKAINEALGEERGLRWVSCEPVPLKPTIMSRMYVEFYWRGPHAGSAVLARSTLTQLAGRNAAQSLINECAGLKDKENLLKTVSKAHPAIQPTRNLEARLGQLVLSSKHDKPRGWKVKGHENMFGIRPVVVGYHSPAPKQEGTEDTDVAMLDAPDATDAADSAVPNADSKQEGGKDMDVVMQANSEAPESESEL